MRADVIYAYMDSPLGRLLMVGRDDGVLTSLSVADHPSCVPPLAGWVHCDTPLARVREQLEEYFDGSRTSFDLAIDPAGTPFQARVWGALRQIPYGHTLAYGELARQIGRPNAARAVGAANGRNPIFIVIPCHRVIGADGSLTGFGWGTGCKAWLLDHERPARLL
ncbi:MAG: methylated-DNA--[protein]-cysteine S-methyltransferase [Acidimicrobiaceae bacterium]|nr:methylated-DNA--[protein]-cysteine S-methyltransferase [Acidimicrobiaceae bacterium]